MYLPISWQKLKLMGLAVRAIALTILLSSLFGAIQERAAADATHWNYAAHAAPSELMTQVQQDNLRPEVPIDLGRMQIWKIQQSGQSAPLYLIDSQIADLAKYPQANPLCGRLGCAFLGYIPTDNGYVKVLDLYLKPQLPPDITLFAPSEILQHGLPVLRVNQLESNQRQ
ncbi:MAG: hypothetical protein F6K19_23125, partial [Cyanothece sp. SIO1E1]|nr:hypothetical protein [Cyanothece sp. SIO1E1]